MLSFIYQRCSMLTKQGIFNRGSQSSGRAPVQSGRSPITPLNSSSSSSLQADSHLTPGQLAAIESATLPTTPATETKPSAAVVKPDSNSGSRLTVGPDVKLKGAEILNCDTLIVEGRVEATMDSRVIQIAANGSFSGKVGIDVAEIYGQFDGDLTARNQLIIHGSGRVSGKIRYGKILIEEGGELSGDIASISEEPAGQYRAGDASRKNETLKT
jgi:cytoskeletal protein CcmA (bactofilin family)